MLGWLSLLRIKKGDLLAVTETIGGVVATPTQITGLVGSP
jgi:hypothetical protein